MAATSASVFRNLDCLSLFAYSKYNSAGISNFIFFIFFSKMCASKLGVRLIYGCGLYMDVYGSLEFAASGRQACLQLIPFMLIIVVVYFQSCLSFPGCFGKSY